MAEQPIPTIQNSFIAGLKTEFTGLNFPENAATDTQNCVYTLIGDVLRREGIDYETNFAYQTLGDRTNSAVSSYRWKNVGGDGLTEMVVLQVGATLYFFKSSVATIASPLSTQLISSNVLITNFQATGNVNTPGITECQYADGNGFLVVYHPDLDPFSVTFNSANNTVTPTVINLQIRDFQGIPEVNVADNFRPSVLSAEHQYNLVNQGWSVGGNWSGQGTNNSLPIIGGLGTWDWPVVGNSWTINISSQANTTSISNGSTIQVSGQAAVVGPNNGNLNFTMTVTGTVTSYVTPFSTVTITIATVSQSPGSGQAFAAGIWSGGNFIGTPNETLTLTQLNVGFINTWQSAIGNFPSNSDIWWLYKNTSNLFAPGTQFSSVQQNVGAAPKGAYIINPFKQLRASISGVAGLTDITTTTRPSTGCWFQGRVFYAGINASFQPTGDAPYTTWTENIYFSQTIQNPTQFGKCFQVNDPTTQDLFDILPTDGGVITIQGAGAIYKLFSLENGLLVFASNGIWFITGSQGIGFAAEDYTIRKISNIQSISPTSFINVNGYPMFWNEEGIYYVTPSQQGVGLGQNATSFQVTNLALGTILTYYQNIPKQSKKFARGDYNSIDYIVQWCFRSTNESSVTDRYQYDSILNFNVVNKAFYPYTLSVSALSNGNTPFIHDIRFVQNPGGSGAPAPIFKYITSVKRNTVYQYIFSEENDLAYVDWRLEDGVGTNFISYFITGYNLAGRALYKFQPLYVYFFLRNLVDNSYKYQAIWDYAINRDSGKFGGIQLVQDNTSTSNFNMKYRRHKLRGRGMAFQIKVQSFQGQPFDIMGWSVLDMTNTGL